MNFKDPLVECRICGVICEKKGSKQKYCDPCGTEKRREQSRQGHSNPSLEAAARKALRYEQFKQLREHRVNTLAEIKLTAGCMDCGYNEYAVALDFDHRADEIKAYMVSDMVKTSKAWVHVWQEVMKCDVVCAICHRIRTAQRKGSPFK